jgi:hypothetical protein
MKEKKKHLINLKALLTYEHYLPAWQKIQHQRENEMEMMHALENSKNLEIS